MERVMPVARGRCISCGAMVAGAMSQEAARRLGAGTDEATLTMAKLKALNQEKWTTNEISGSVIRCPCGGIAMVEECG